MDAKNYHTLTIDNVWCMFIREKVLKSKMHYELYYRPQTQWSYSKQS
jgi:hypothetical protein